MCAVQKVTDPPVSCDKIMRTIASTTRPKSQISQAILPGNTICILNYLEKITITIVWQIYVIPKEKQNNQNE